MTDATGVPTRQDALPARRIPPRVLYAILRLDYVVAGILFAALVVITFAGVIFRYFLNRPFVWMIELQLALFIGMVFIAGGAAFRTGGHVAIDVLVNKLPHTLRRVVEILGHAATLFILAFYCYCGFELVRFLADLDRVTNVLNIPASLIYSVVPIGSALMIINYLFTLFFAPTKEEINDDH